MDNLNKCRLLYETITVHQGELIKILANNNSKEIGSFFPSGGVRFLYENSYNDDSIFDENLNKNVQLLADLGIVILESNEIDDSVKIPIIEHLNIVGFLFDRARCNYYVHQEKIFRFIDSLGQFVYRFDENLMKKNIRFNFLELARILEENARKADSNKIVELDKIRKTINNNYSKSYEKIYKNWA